MVTHPLRLAILLAFGSFLLTGSPVRGRPDEKVDEKTRTTAPRRLDLSKQPNDDLLKQAAAIYSKSAGDYNAAMRSLRAAEAQLDEAVKKLAELAPRAIELKKETATEKGNTEDAAKSAVDSAQIRAELARAKLKLTQARKALQDRVASEIESVQSAAAAFQNTLDDLKPFAFEIELRIKDGTISGRPPEWIEAAATSRKELVAEQDRLKSRSAAARKAIETSARLLDEADKQVSGAEAEFTEASRVFAREQQRKELEKKYTGKSSDDMLGELNQLVQDGIGLKGTYELAYSRFSSQANVAQSLRKEIEALKRPDAKIAQLTRAEDVQLAAKSIEGLIAYYNSRVSRLETLLANLTSLAKRGGEFEADAAVSDDHLFKMQVLSTLLDKSGQANKLPEQAGLKRLAEAADRAKKLASEVRASTERARVELPVIEKELIEAKTARDAATLQLEGLKQSQDATLAALQFEEKLAKMSSAQVLEEFARLRKEVIGKTAALKSEAVAFKQASTAVAESRAKLDALKDPFLRAAEEQGQPERLKILAELRKEAGLDRAPKDATPPLTPESKKADDRKAEPVDEKDGKKKAEPQSPLERATAQLVGFQQQLAARVRVLDEREEKSRALVGALEGLETKASAYVKTLGDTRQCVLQLNAAAVAIKTLVGRGELETDKIPEDITESLSVEARRELESDAASALNALSQTRQELESRKKTDPQAESLKTLSKDLLALVGQRIDLLGDLKKLDSEYKIVKKDRPVSEQKRLDQTAAERMGKDSGKWDWLLAIDTSKPATNLSELIETYYREVSEIEDREENLKKQKKAVDELIELTAKERTAILNGLSLFEKELIRLEVVRDEEAVLAHARLKPETADELLKSHQAKTGRVLPKPLPLGDKDRAARVDELGNSLFERSVQIEAAKKWDQALNARLATAGLTAEAGAFQDELAQLTATSGTNARRVHLLTGNPPPESGTFGTGDQTRLPATGGDIGKARTELRQVRTRGVQMIALKIGAVLLSALLLPRLIMFVLRRSLGRKDEAGSSSMVVSAVGAFLKVAVWVIALAMILSILGFDVTAIIAGLGIGGLAIGLAAQPMISDVIGAIIIFAERRFKIGDVVRLGSDDPARVVGLSWRSTALKNASGLVVSVPNRKVTEATIQNLTRTGQTYDQLDVTISTNRDVNKVIEVIKEAMKACENLTADHGVSVKKFNQKGETKIAEYRFWWFLRDYEARNKTRDEVFSRIGAGLADENMAGTEVTLA